MTITVDGVTIEAQQSTVTAVPVFSEDGSTLIGKRIKIAIVGSLGDTEGS